MESAKCTCRFWWTFTKKRQGCYRVYNGGFKSSSMLSPLWVGYILSSAQCWSISIFSSGAINYGGWGLTKIMPGNACGERTGPLQTPSMRTSWLAQGIAPGWLPAVPAGRDLVDSLSATTDTPPYCPTPDTSVSGDLTMRPRRLRCWRVNISSIIPWK